MALCNDPKLVADQLNKLLPEATKKFATGGIVRGDMMSRFVGQQMFPRFYPYQRETILNMKQAESRIHRYDPGKAIGKTVTYDITFDAKDLQSSTINISGEIEKMKIEVVKRAMAKFLATAPIAILKGLGITKSQAADPFKTNKNHFVFQQVYPDMVAKKFGFGRLAVCNALVKLKITSWDKLQALTVAQVEEIKDSAQVGPKVFAGFFAYMAERGVLLPGVVREQPVTLTPPAA